jgi:short-subunit dehydrogenase
MRWQIVWITGASTGIGRQVALDLAHRGVKVIVSARSADKLAEVAALSPNIVALPLDVVDAAAVRAAAEKIRSEHGPIDLALLNAGIWDPMGAANFSAERVAATMAINFQGVANGVEAVLPAMVARRYGHIALVSSVAGYRGLPKAAAYAPSKAAVIALGEVLRSELGGTGVAITVVNPGFVSTPMTAVNTFPMPFIISVEDASKRIIAGLERRRFEVTFPWRLALLMKFLRIVPYRLFFGISRSMARNQLRN